MSLRVRERLGLADVMTLCNAAVGVVAMVAAVTLGPAVAARLVLLAAVADGLDGIIARARGGTQVGPFLDSMADIVSFGAAPALFLFGATFEAISLSLPPGTPRPGIVAVLAASAVPAVVVVFSLVRTALYTVYVGEDENRPGIQNTLAASILAAGYLAGVTGVAPLLAGGVVLSVLMVAPVPYPKLAARDALVMGVVQAGAILGPTVGGRAFPRVLFAAALAYMTLAPWFYWGE
ncbi:MAG: CDP-diacylglycerol--serine O-phosphatidyltransferase [Halobacteriales archaeon SW_9_67_25]|nr:MAG: CDP-diacylglycerol--serine O-phosphatidyltransferase [Halobacteriales archaeon SW_9_67_25]